MKKKFITMALILCMGLSAVACGKGKASDEGTQGAETASDVGESSNYMMDGVWIAHLSASEKDKIGTTDEDGNLYAIIYAAEASDDAFTVTGTMDFKTDKTSEIVGNTDDEPHNFKVDSNTKYLMWGGENGPDEVSAEEFLNYINGCMESGLLFEVEVVDGVAVSLSISA